MRLCKKKIYRVTESQQQKQEKRLLINGDTGEGREAQRSRKSRVKHRTKSKDENLSDGDESSDKERAILSPPNKCSETHFSLRVRFGGARWLEEKSDQNERKARREKKKILLLDDDSRSR